MMVGCLALVLAFRKRRIVRDCGGLRDCSDWHDVDYLDFVRGGCANAGAGAWSKSDRSSAVFADRSVVFGANLAKVADGGWIPLAVAIGIFIVMTTWKAGRAALEQFVQSASLPMDLFLGDLQSATCLG